jgi:hypothetical protein
VIEMQKQFELMLLKDNKVIENEVIQNYEMNIRISQLKTLMKKYKIKNIELYKSVQQEYLSLIR